jgi:hypothetical protein
MRLVKQHGAAYPDSIDLNPTSEPITIYSVSDDSSNTPVSCSWYCTPQGEDDASHPGSLNAPSVGGKFPLGIDPSDPVQVQNTCSAVTGTSCTFYPAPPQFNAQPVRTRLVATYGSQSRSLLINISN